MTVSGGMVGRDPELRVVDTAIEALRHGQGGVLAIVGPAGVGKSRLGREAAVRAGAADVAVLTGRAVATGGSTPYRPLIEALAPWARTHSREDVELGAHARAFDVLVPGWAAGPPEPLSPVFVAEAVLRLLPHVSADRPVVLLIEDVHWADEETLASIEYVADAAEALPLLLVLTARDDEGPIARRLIRALAARGAARLVSLNPLTAEATQELAELRLGASIAPTLASLLADRAEGLPLFVEEILVALEATGALATAAGGAAVDVIAGSVGVLPDTVADTVAARLEGMPDEQRIVIETAALLGRSFDHELVVAVQGAAVAPALQAATTLGLVHEDPDRAGQLRFRHALLRDGVVASTFPPRRTELAASLLQQLTAHELSDDELAIAVELAARAGENTLAARFALRRAMNAFDMWAMGTAERGLAEAREYAGADPDLLIEIDVSALRVASIVGRLAVVMQIGQALLVRLGAPGGRYDEELLETHLRLGQTLLEEEKWREAQPHIEMATSLIGVGDTCQVSRLEMYLSLLAHQQGDVDGARAGAARAADLARPYDYQTDIVCCALMWEGRAWLPDVETARARWQESLDYADANGLRLWHGRMVLELATLEADELRGLASEVDDALKQADALAREYGGVETQTRVALVQARLGLIRGEIEAATESLARAVAYGIAGGVSRRARPDLEAAIGLMRAEVPDSSTMSPSAEVFAALIADDVEAARVTAAGVDRKVRRGPLALFVDLVAADDTSYGAVVEANALLPDFGAAVARLDAAPLVAAFFTRLHASGAAEERDALQAAVATFDRLGFARPADACRAMLRTAGVPVPRRTSAQDGVPADLKTAGVTARELDVLRLIAEGKTNKDVAEALFLSPRTVEKHVERLLLKTGAANRTALAAMLARS